MKQGSILRRTWMLGGIFILGLLVRVLFLSSHPSGFTPDEASFGYDAYSILKTGRDQWGNFLPITLKSFGDGKMPLYAYLSIPSILIFGLSEFAVRFPNALLGSLAIVVLFFLTKEVFKNKKLALFVSFLLAISPWHIQMSRGAFEANLTTFFLPLGAFLFLKGLRSSKLMIGSGMIFGLNLFSYHSGRLVTPLVILGMLWCYRDKLKKQSNFVVSLIVFLMFLIVAGWSYLNGAGTRVASSSILQIIGNVGEHRYKAVMSGAPDMLARLFNNKITFFTHIFSQNYLSYFSTSFLLNQGANEGTYGMVPGNGVIYLIEGLFLIVFLIYLVRGKLQREQYWLVFWLIVAPIPASLAVGPGHAANRAVVMLPALQIILGLGGFYLYEELVKKYHYRRKIQFFYILIMIVSFVFFLEDYFIQQRARFANQMLYGAVDVMKYLQGQENQYDEMIVSKGLSEPHIYLAFVQRYDPREYQLAIQKWGFEEHGVTWVDQIPEYSLGKYTFKSLGRDVFERKENKKILIVGRGDEYANDFKTTHIVYYPNKKPAFWFVEAK